MQKQQMPITRPYFWKCQCCRHYFNSFSTYPEQSHFPNCRCLTLEDSTDYEAYKQYIHNTKVFYYTKGPKALRLIRVSWNQLEEYFE